MSTVDYIQPETTRDEARGKKTVLNLILMISRVGALVAIFIAFGLMVPGYAFFSAANIENTFTIRDAGEVKKRQCKTLAPASHLELVSVAVSCRECRGNSHGQSHPAMG